MRKTNMKEICWRDVGVDAGDKCIPGGAFDGKSGLIKSLNFSSLCVFNLGMTDGGNTAGDDRKLRRRPTINYTRIRQQVTTCLNE